MWVASFTNPSIHPRHSGVEQSSPEVRWVDLKAHTEGLWPKLVLQVFEIKAIP